MFGGRDVDCLSVSMATVGRQQSAAAVSWSAGSPSQAGCCALLSGDANINSMSMSMSISVQGELVTLFF